MKNVHQMYKSRERRSQPTDKTHHNNFIDMPEHGFKFTRQLGLPLDMGENSSRERLAVSRCPFEKVVDKPNGVTRKKKHKESRNKAHDTDGEQAHGTDEEQANGTEGEQAHGTDLDENVLCCCCLLFVPTYL